MKKDVSLRSFSGMTRGLAHFALSSVRWTSLCAVLFGSAVWVEAQQTVAYPLVLQNGFNYVGCELNGVGGNNINNLTFLQVPASLSDPNLVNNALLYIYNCSTASYSTYIYFSAQDAAINGLGPAGWYDYNTFNLASNVTWSPGEGVILYNFGSPATLTVSGTVPTPILPPANYCGCGGWSLLCSQASTIGASASYQAVTGFSPQPGAMVAFTASNGVPIVSDIFSNGVWNPGTPSFAYGQAAYFFVPCVSNLPPSISQQPQSLISPAGSNATFSVTASGTTPLSYNWQFNGTNLSDNVHINGSQSNTLTIISANPSDTGNLQVIITNGYGSITSSVAMLTVVPAQITGFGGNGGGWTLNGSPVAPGVSNDVLHITDVTGYYQARSAFYNVPMPITRFTCSFIYQELTALGAGGGPYGGAYNPADGTVFTLQNQGAAALGACCGQLGYSGITNATGVAFHIFSTPGYADNIPGTGYAPTTVPSAGNGLYLNTSPVNLLSGDPLLVTLTYDGTTLWEQLLDTITLASFSTSYTVDLPGAVGGATAFVGFTGGTGAGAADQRISSFAFGVPPTIVTQPSSLTNSAGATATFTVFAAGTAPLHYQWQFNGTNLNDGGRIGGSQSNVLQIANMMPQDAGNYQVIVANNYGSISSTPATLSLLLPLTNNLSLWLRGDLGVTTNAAGQVSFWADQSGAAHHASQTVTSQQPLLLNNGLGGLPILRFSASASDYLNLTSQVLNSQQFTIFAVVSDTSTGTGNREIFSEWTTTNGLTSVYFGTTKNNPVQARLTDYFNINGVGSLSNPTADFIYTGVSGATNAAVFQNQSLIASTNTPLSTRVLTSPYVIGRQGFANNSEYWQGDIAEILVYNAELNTSQRTQIWSYLLSRYSQPVFTTQPLSQTVATGGSVVFSASAPTLTPLTYQWFVNGSPLTNSSRITGLHSNVLTITNLAGGDAGGYQLIVSNTYGVAASTVAALTVVPARNLTWNGTPNGNWDTANMNWLTSSNPASYNQGDWVTFDDTLAGRTNVNLTTTLRPGSLVINNSISNYLFSGAGSIAGPVGLVKNGSGSVTLGGTGGDNFAGGITVNSGRVLLDDANAAISGGTVVGTGATLQIGNGDANGSLPSGSVALNGTLTFARSVNTTVPNLISGVGAGTLIQSNGSTLTVSGNNLGFTGAVVVAQGTLKIGAGNALGSRTNVLVTIKTGATLDFGGIAGSNSVTVSGLGVGGNGALVNSGALQISALQFISLAGDTVFGGTGRWDLRGPPAALLAGGQPFKITKVGTNQVSLVGVGTIDSALGDVDIQQGTFAIQTTTVQVGNPTNTITVRSNAVLDVWNLNSSPLNKRILLNDGATIYNESGASIITGPVTLNTNSAGAAGTAKFNVAITTTLLFNGPVNGPGNLAKVGPGFLSLNGTNGYAGSTTVNAGTLSLSTSGSIPNSANITIAAGAVLDASSRPDQTLSLTSGQALQGNGTVSGNLACSLGSTVSPGTLNSVGALAVSGNLNLQGTAVLKLNPLAGTNDLLNASAITYGGTLIASNQAGFLASGNNFKLFSAGSYTGTFASILPATPSNGLVWDTSLLNSSGILAVVGTNSLAIYQQPQAFAQCYTGGTITFSILAGSAAPLSYQWMYNTSQPVPGATNASLTLNAVQLTNAGNYTCVVSNQFGTLTSSNTLLVVLPAGNICLPPPAGLASWWPGNLSAADVLGGNNGVLVGGVTFTNGEAGQSFNFDGTTGFVGTSLLLTNPQTFSLSLWFKTTTTKGGVLLGFGDSQLGTAANFDRNLYLDNAGAIHFGLWTGAYQKVNTAAVYNDNAWHHVVASLSPSSGMSLYVDGVLATNNAAVNSAQIYNGWWRIGDNNLSGWPQQPASFYFKGQIDEVSMFNRALSANEVAAIYAAGSQGMCLNPLPPIIVLQPNNQIVPAGNSAAFALSAIGALPLGYQWLFNGTNLTDNARVSGSQSGNLTIASSQPSDAGSYQVIVTNSYGAVTSALVSLTILGPPQITAQPTNQFLAQGDIATFAVTATGSTPLAYQWGFNGTALSGATNSILTLVGVTPQQAGAYGVLVSNAYGSVTSQSALLVVGPGQVSTLWSIAPGSRPYLTTNNTERGLAYDPVSRHLALISRASGTNLVYILDAQTGSDLYTLDNGSNGLSGGFFLLDMIGAADDGALYAGNLTLDSSSSAFKLYRWADDGPTTQPTVAFSGDPSPGNPQRYGDTLAVRGSGTNTQILFGSRNGTNVVLLTTTDGINFAPPSINISGVAPGNFGLGLAFGPSNTFWGKSYNLPLCQCSFDPVAATGAVAQVFSGAQFPLDVAPIGVSPGFNWLAGIPLSEASQYVQVYALPATGAPILVATNLFQANNTNLNGTGEIAFNGDILYALNSNNGLLAAQIQPASAPPTLTAQPQNLAVAIGSNATFNVTATGASPLTYQWRFNGMNLTDNAQITGSQSNVLTMTGITMANAGTYQVLVTNAYGMTDTFATLTVTPATPLITWSNPAAILYGTALSSNQLNALASVPGSLAYNPPMGTVPNAGTTTLSASFSPADTNNYYSITTSVSLVVAPAPLNVTAANATRSFGQTNPVFTGTLAGITNGDNITASYTCSALLTSLPNVYPVVPVLFDPNNRLANYSLTTNIGALTVTSGAQVLAHDDAAAYNAAGGAWSNAMNFGFGFQPWVITTGGPGVQHSAIGDGGNIATTNNSAWALYAGGFVSGSQAVAYRGFSNSLPRGMAFKLDWRSDNFGYSADSFAGFSLRTGNASASTADYTNGERFCFFYHGYSEVGQDDVTLRDGSGEHYLPLPGVTFSNLSQGIMIEFTLLSADTYRLVVLDAATTNKIAEYDSTLAASGTIDSVALFNQETGDCECSGNQVFNNLEISNPSNPVAPMVSVTPASFAAAPGDNATFTALATGTPPLVYQWQFNGADLAGANNSSLTLTNVQVGNGGHYDVVVTSPYGTMTSAPAKLTVYTPTTILTGPQSAQVSVGGSAVFSVVALSSSPLNYQWFLNGTAIPGATNASFTVANAQLTDNGATYSVQVVNLAGAVASASAALLVQPAPPPLIPTTSYTVQLQAGTNLIANQLNTGGNTLKEIMPVVPDGTVVSKYDNISGAWSSATYNAALGAWIPSSIVLRPGEGALLVSPTSFSLTFTGTPNVPVLPLNIPPGTAWLVSRQTNDLGTYANIVGVDPTPGAVVYKWNPTNGSYVVFSYLASGWSNGVTPVASVGESVWVGPGGGAPTPVPAPPAISQQPVNVTVAQGGSTSFSVAATGTQPLYYQWQLNGNGIPGATNSTLNLPDVQAGNAGNYNVAVYNSIGISKSSTATLTISSFGTLPFADNFANAGPLGASTSGSGTGNNLSATTEAGENITPDLIPSSATVWLSWQPPAGIASVNTIGSGFDTVLAVYTGTSLTDLQLVAADDDSAPNLCSSLSFNAVGGKTYYLQVGGFKGAMGSIVLSWNVVQTADQVPQIVNAPQSQTQTNGGAVVLSVTVTNIGTGVSYQWAFQGMPLQGETNSTLNLPALSPDQVGLYTVGITNVQTLLGVSSPPASVEIFNPGLGQPGNFADVGPRDKFFNATSLTPHDPNIPNDPTFAGGFTGTQIFSTTGATADQGEPSHCGIAPCHSVWYSYVPPTTGLLTIYTTNNFPAVLEVYTGPGNSFTNLVPVACSASGTTNGEAVNFGVIAGTNYWVVIDGINCASGAFSVSYNLTAPPAFTVLPVGQTVTNGGRLVLAASTAGTPPFGYQWKFNGTKIPGATNGSLVITNFHSANEGSYNVISRNSFGTNESAPTAVYLSNPPRFISSGIQGSAFSMQFAGAANTNYVFLVSSNLNLWVPLKTNNSPIGIINFSDPVSPGAATRFYRAKIK